MGRSFAVKFCGRRSTTSSILMTGPRRSPILCHIKDVPGRIIARQAGPVLEGRSRQSPHPSWWRQARRSDGVCTSEHTPLERVRRRIFRMAPGQSFWRATPNQRDPPVGSGIRRSRAAARKLPTYLCTVLYSAWRNTFSSISKRVTFLKPRVLVSRESWIAGIQDFHFREKALPCPNCFSMSEYSCNS